MTTDTKFFGSKYHSLGEYPSAADIAKAVRSDIKAAVAAGDLPGSPVAYSVTCENFSMGCAVNVSVRNWQGDPWGGSEFHAGRFLTPEATATMATLERLHQAYNHDGSDISTDHFDVRYYGDVTFETDWARQYRAKEAAKRAANKDKPKRPKVNKRGLQSHVRDQHNLTGTDRANFDTLTLWHRIAHKNVARPGTHWAKPHHTDHPYETYGGVSS